MMEQTPVDVLPGDALSPPESPAAQVSAPVFESHPFSFHGQGGEFFRIWIVNIVLTIVTLGIYSAWAKVRTHQYFYGNTQVAGGSFQYLAKPMTILKGRIIAVILFVAYVLLNQYYPAQTILVSILLFIFVVPWIIVRSLRFNLRNTAFRNIRFDFTGSYGSAFVNFVLGYLAVIFSLGIAFPWWVRQLNKFLVNHIKYGDAEFKAELDVGEYYIAFLLCIVISFGVYFLIAVGMGFMLLSPLFGGVLASILGIIGFSFVKAFLNARLGNLLFNNMELRGNRFSSKLEPVALTKLYLSNALLIICTLGLAIPWVICRLVSYRIETLTLQAIDLESFVAEQTDSGSAIGEEIGDVFDVELGF